MNNYLLLLFIPIIYPVPLVRSHSKWSLLWLYNNHIRYLFPFNYVKRLCSLVTTVVTDRLSSTETGSVRLDIVRAPEASISSIETCIDYFVTFSSRDSHVELGATYISSVHPIPVSEIDFKGKREDKSESSSDVTSFFVVAPVVVCYPPSNGVSENT